MTPEKIEILLHYFSKNSDPESLITHTGDSVEEIIQQHIHDGLMQLTPFDQSTEYRLTDVGKAFVEALCSGVDVLLTFYQNSR